MLSNQAVADSTGAPVSRVSAYWPIIVASLRARGIDTPAVEQAVVATIGTEVPDFRLITEYGGPDDFANREPGTSLGKALGNTQVGDGYRYRGRGWLQLTGRGNYRAAGNAVGVDLQEAPDMALTASVAADVLAWYFDTRGVANAAQAGDWRAVRRLVNGGYNGWDRFSAVLANLGTASAAVGGLGILLVGALAWLFLRR